MDYISGRIIPEDGGVAGNISPPSNTFPVRLTRVFDTGMDPMFMYLMIFAMGFVLATVIIIAIKTVNK